MTVDVLAADERGLNPDLHKSIFNLHLVSLDPVHYRQTFPIPHIKLPPVPTTFNNVSAHRSLSQRIPLVRAEVFGGIEFATHIVNS